MTSHQFARQLLCEPDLPILTTGDNYEDLLEVGFTKIEAVHSSDPDLVCPSGEEVIVIHRVGSDYV